MQVQELGPFKMTGKKFFFRMKVKFSLEMTVVFTYGKGVTNPGCISPGTSKKISVMIWGCITYHGVGTLCRVNGNINCEK